MFRTDAAELGERLCVVGVLKNEAHVGSVEETAKRHPHRTIQKPRFSLAGREDVTQTRHGVDDRRQARETRRDRSVDGRLERHVVYDVGPLASIHVHDVGKGPRLVPRVKRSPAPPKRDETEVLPENLLAVRLDARGDDDFESGVTGRTGNRNTVGPKVPVLRHEIQDLRTDGAWIMRECSHICLIQSQRTSFPASGQPVPLRSLASASDNLATRHIS